MNASLEMIGCAGQLLCFIFRMIIPMSAIIESVVRLLRFRSPELHMNHRCVAMLSALQANKAMPHSCHAFLVLLQCAAKSQEVDHG